MKITVLGLTHLGCVTAACCAEYFEVVALDYDPLLISDLNRGRHPIAEPDVEELFAQGLESKKLTFSCAPEYAVSGADILWCSYDIKVNEQDVSDVAGTLGKLAQALQYAKPETLILISSQIPVGTIAQLEADYPHLDFAYSPENLRHGRAVRDFREPGRTIIGLRKEKWLKTLVELFEPFGNNPVFVKVESAEMIKHGLNGFLGLSIAYINEIKQLCQRVGADPVEVANGIKSDSRIGHRAYLTPGGPFRGGTIGRDLVHLNLVASNHKVTVPIISAVIPSNNLHEDFQ